MIKTKVAFLGGLLFSSQSEQSEIFSKIPDWLEKSRPLITFDWLEKSLGRKPATFKVVM